MRRPRLIGVTRRLATSVGAFLVLAATACSSGAGPAEVAGVSTTPGSRPQVVATTSILGDVVSSLVGDRATVTVLIPNGQDPHDYAPSAHDVEALRGAALVVANGLGLEAQAERAIESARRDGVAVFRASDHVSLRRADSDRHGHDEGGRDGAEDPHLWTSPAAMAELIEPLASELGAALSTDLGEPAAREAAALDALDAEIRTTMSAIPSGRCVLVTGHDALGYFADRYGCEIVGTIIPGFTSTAEASAGDLADLAETVRDHGTRVVFTEVGTPTQVARRVADDLDVELVELPSHALPSRGGYPAFIRQLASRIVRALAR